MQEKNKKTLLDIIVLIIIVVSVLMIFIPTISFDYSDVLKEQGIENPNWYWTMDNTIMYSHRTEYFYQNDLSNKPSEYHLYRIFGGILKFEIGNSETDVVTDYTREEDVFLSRNMTYLMIFSIASIAYILCVYFAYKGIKLRFIKKNKFFLYIGIICLVGLPIYLITSYYLISFVDTNNLGYTNFITFGYGFYIACIVIFLTFLAYIIQSYLLDLPEEKTIVSNIRSNDFKKS